MKFNRRGFVQRSGAVAAAFASPREWASKSAHTKDNSKSGTPLESDFYGTIDLLDGFSYTVISEIGDRMDAGLHVPCKCDGMDAFPGFKGTTTLGDLAGPCFSPVGSTLFVNIQGPAVTLAITGPRESLFRTQGA